MHSELWFNISHLSPALSASVRLHRQLYRGTVHYLLQDRISGKHHRLNAHTFALIGRFDGQQTISEIWDFLKNENQQATPSQNEVVNLISQLKQAELIQTGEVNPALIYAEKHQQQQRSQLKQRLNPLSLRFPLFDPGFLLDRISPVLQWIFSPLSLLLWLVAMTLITYLAASHWDTLIIQGGNQLVNPLFWLYMALSYPVMKGIHELSHAIAIRRYGGEVNEMGISLLVFIPLPYVNASAASAFQNKWQRMLVGAAGIMAELSLSAIALLLWLNISEGLLRDFAFAILTLGGVSTLLFNGNPLLKFDGYHVLSDWLEIPNFSKKCALHWAYWAKKIFVGLKEVHPVAKDRNETVWFTGYGLAAYLYRLGLTLTLATLFLDISIWLSAFVVALMLFSLIIKPLYQIIRYLLNSEEIHRHRFRAWSSILVIMPLLIIGITIVPIPHNTLAQAVSWLPDSASVRTASDGFIRSFEQQNHAHVKPGDVIVVLENDLLQVKHDTLIAKQKAVQAELKANLSISAQKTRRFENTLRQIDKEVQELQLQLQALHIRAGHQGTLYIPQQQDKLDSWVAKGEVLAYVLPEKTIELRSVVPQKDGHFMELPKKSIEVNFSDEPEKNWQATLSQAIPATSLTLPAAALSQQRGGNILTTADDAENLTPTEPVFIVNLKIKDFPIQRIGARAWIRFHHGQTTLLKLWSLRWRQLFMQHVTARS